MNMGKLNSEANIPNEKRNWVTPELHDLNVEETLGGTISVLHEKSSFPTVHGGTVRGSISP